MNKPIIVYNDAEQLVEIEETPFSTDDITIRTISNYAHEITIPADALEAAYHHLQLLKIQNRR